MSRFETAGQDACHGVSNGQTGTKTSFRLNAILTKSTAKVGRRNSLGRADRGPYGSGKSTFALRWGSIGLAKVLAGQEMASWKTDHGNAPAALDSAPCFKVEADCLCPVTYVEFAKQIAQMKFNRIDRNAEFPRQLSIALTGFQRGK